MLSVTRLTPTRRARLAALAAVTALALPATAGAQSVRAPTARLHPVTVTTTRSAEANALSDQAIALYGTPAKFRHAATLHLRAVDLRTPGDPRGYDDLRMAGHLFYAAGKLRQAREAMERAAEHAAARGDLLAAATSYVDAGYVAIEEHRTDRVPTLALKAELLAQSPLLSDAQRAAILNRVGYSQVVAMIPR